MANVVNKLEESGNNNITTQELITNSATRSFYEYNNLAEGYIDENKSIGELLSAYIYRGQGEFWDATPIVTIDQKNIVNIL